MAPRVTETNTKENKISGKCKSKFLCEREWLHRRE